MPPSLGAEQPFHIAVCLFPGFQLLDLCGPLDILNVLDRTHPLRLSILSTSLEPVTTHIPSAPVDAPFQQHLVPTHTFAAPPEGVQAIFVPGGFGARKPPPELLQYLRENGSAPSVEFLMSVCTGSALLAMAGLLDGKKATSNKRSFNWVVEQGPNVEWVRKARWVEDGSTWTSSGVAAGMDMTLAWIAKTCGEDVAKGVADGIEYDWHRDSTWDPFAELYIK